MVDNGVQYTMNACIVHALITILIDSHSRLSFECVLKHIYFQFAFNTHFLLFDSYMYINSMTTALLSLQILPNTEWYRTNKEQYFSFKSYTYTFS